MEALEVFARDFVSGEACSISPISAASTPNEVQIGLELGGEAR
jgi:hypothetical protein